MGQHSECQCLLTGAKLSRSTERELVRVFAQDAAVAARRKARGKGGERRGETTLQERYGDVHDFWTRLPPARRQQLMRVPIRRLLEGAPHPGPRNYECASSEHVELRMPALPARPEFPVPGLPSYPGWEGAGVGAGRGRRWRRRRRRALLDYMTPPLAQKPPRTLH